MLTGDYYLALVGFKLRLEHFDNIRRGKYLLNLRITTIF